MTVDIARVRQELLGNEAVTAALERRLLSGPLDGAESIIWSVPERGKRSAILIATDPDADEDDLDGRVIVRLSRQLVPLVRMAMNMRRLGRLGLPVPTVEGLVLRARLGRVGHFALFESFLPGIPAVDVMIDPAADHARRLAVVEAVADTLATLHSHRRARHGWFLWPRSGPYVNAYLPRVTTRCRRMASALAEIGRGDVLGRLESGLMKAAGPLTSPAPYALIHGKVYANNFLIDGLDDGSGDVEAAMVDLGTVHYADAARDIVRAEARVCRDDPKLVASFLARYLDRVDGLDAERLAVQRPFYAADLAITRAAGVLRDRRDGVLEGAEFVRTFGAYLDRALSVLGA